MTTPKKIKLLDVTESHLHCFGRFKSGDPICTRSCILCIKCIIAHNQAMQFELLEDLMGEEAPPSSACH